MEMGLCEICVLAPAVARCDNGLYLCVNCAISTGYAYQVEDLVDDSEDDEEDEEVERNEDFETW